MITAIVGILAYWLGAMVRSETVPHCPHCESPQEDDFVDEEAPTR